MHYKKVALILIMMIVFGLGSSSVLGALNADSVSSALEKKEYVWVGNAFESELKPVSLTGKMGKILTQQEFAFGLASEKLVKSLMETKRASVSQAKQYYSEAFNLGSAAQVLDGNRVLVKTGGSGVAEFETEKGKYALQIAPVANVNLIIPTRVNINLDEYVIPIGINSNGQGTVSRIAGVVNDSLVKEASAQEPAGNSKVKVALYFDKNNNQKWDGDEGVMPWAGVRVDLVNLDKQTGISLSDKWKDVYLDGTRDGLKASDLLNDLSANCPSAGVSTIEGNTRKTFIQREGEVFGGDDFDVVPGRVYSIKGCEVPFYIIGYDLKKQFEE